MSIDDEVVMRGNAIYEECAEEFGEDRVLCVCSVGMYNYGFAEFPGELKFLVLYVPSFEDLCTTYAEAAHRRDYIIQDIRALYFCHAKMKGSELELLYARYQKINPIYASIFNRALDKREEIGNYSPFLRTHSAETRALSKLYGGDPFEAMRLKIAAEQYLEGQPLSECFCPTKPYIRRYLLDIKHGVFSIDEEDFAEEFGELISSCDDEEDKNYNTDRMIKTFIIDIMNIALHHSTNKFSFDKSLTTTEKKAFDYLSDKLKETDIVIVTNLVEESGISRPVWKNLLVKMDAEGVAAITNLGTKGTQIKMLI